jgi:serine protease Do
MFAWPVLLFGLVIGSIGTDVLAQDRFTLAEQLYQEFDAREFSTADKRFLQLGLTVEGDYVGLIDGRWGDGSQKAFEAFVAGSDSDARDGLVRNLDVVLLADRTADFLNRHGLAYRTAAPWSHRFLAPPGFFLPDPATDTDDLDLESSGIYITTVRSGQLFAISLHDAFTKQQTSAYTVRKAERLVTGFTGGPYLRSDLLNDIWVTTLVAVEAGVDPRLVDAIAASITIDRTAELLAGNGRIDGLMETARRLAAAPELPSEPARPDLLSAAPPQTTDRTPADQTPADTSGTGFFVNNSDLVTAKHVVEDCRSLTFTDGTPIELVAMHPTLDLALLSSPTRSRNWIAVHRTGAARLGQRVIALGYPFYGSITTALNSTGGNVSALVGLGDDRRLVTVTAPIHPGNSGGPLLALDGTVIGVVIATIDKIAVAEATGAIPENTSYAVTRTELLAFLEAEGTSLPRQDPDPVDFDESIPEGMQQAVVPLICQ